MFVFFWLLGDTTFCEENEFTEMCRDHHRMCQQNNTVTKIIGKEMTRVLRHKRDNQNWCDSKGAIPLVRLSDFLSPQADPLVQCATGRVFAALLEGNDKRRFYVDIYIYDTWFPDEYNMPWDIFIGCQPGTLESYCYTK